MNANAIVRETKKELINHKFVMEVRYAMQDNLTYTYTDKGWERIHKDFHDQCLRLKDDKIKMVAFRSRNPWSNSNGYVQRGDDTTIYLNTRKKLNPSELIGFLVHELMHFAGYGHGTGRCQNSMSWVCGGRKKRKSVPVKLARLAREVYDSRQERKNG